MNLKKEFLNKSNIVKLILCLFLIALPFLCDIIISLCNGYNGSFRIFIPAWSDEFGWYHQVDSIIHYGAPLGYYGYNESFAAVGTFGPWGIAPLLPYALLGSIFGWSLSSMAIFNMTFLSISILSFILLTKPTNKQFVFLIIGYLSLYITVGYSMTAMSESLRYAGAIFLAGFIIWVERHTADKSKKLTVAEKVVFIVGSIISLYFVQVYVILSLAVFPLTFFALRRTKLNTLLRFIISVIATMIVAALSFMLISATTCPYFMPSTIELISERIRTEGLFAGIGYALGNFKDNIVTAFSLALGNGGDEHNNIILWYFIAYIGLLVLLLVWQTVKIFRKKDVISGENIFLNLSLFFLSGFLAGYCLLYTASYWTLCRGINTALVMSAFLLAFCNVNTPRRFQAVMPLLAVMSVFTYYGNVINERYQIAQQEANIISEREKISEVITISPQKSRWENTINLYGYEVIYISLPVGAGYNSIIGGSSEKAGYAVIPSTIPEENRPDFESMGYVLIYSDDCFYVYKNTK